jgi:hypothetical protein
MVPGNGNTIVDSTAIAKERATEATLSTSFKSWATSTLTRFQNAAKRTFAYVLAIAAEIQMAKESMFASPVFSSSDLEDFITEEEAARETTSKTAGFPSTFPRIRQIWQQPYGILRQVGRRVHNNAHDVRLLREMDAWNGFND